MKFISKALRMARVQGIAQFYLPPTRLSTMEWAILPSTPSRSASQHSDRYSFLVPQRVGGWVGLGGWLHTEVACQRWHARPKTVTHPSTNRRPGIEFTTIEPNPQLKSISLLGLGYAAEKLRWSWVPTLPSLHHWSLGTRDHPTNVLGYMWSSNDDVYLRQSAACTRDTSFFHLIRPSVHPSSSVCRARCCFQPSLIVHLTQSSQIRSDVHATRKCAVG